MKQSIVVRTLGILALTASLFVGSISLGAGAASAADDRTSVKRSASTAQNFELGNLGELINIANVVLPYILRQGGGNTGYYPQQQPQYYPQQQPQYYPQQQPQYYPQQQPQYYPQQQPQYYPQQQPQPQYYPQQQPQPQYYPQQYPTQQPQYYPQQQQQQSTPQGENDSDWFNF